MLTELTEGRTDRQTDNNDFTVPSVGRASNKCIPYAQQNSSNTPFCLHLKTRVFPSKEPYLVIKFRLILFYI